MREKPRASRDPRRDRSRTGATASCAVGCTTRHVSVRAAARAVRQPGLRRPGRPPGPAELAAFSAVLSTAAPSRSRGRIGGVPTWPSTPSRQPRDVAYLANLSSAYALFELVDGDLLRPVDADAAGPLRRRPDHHPEVRRQDQRAVHQAAAQRHAAGLAVGARMLDGAAHRARPAVRPGHHAQPGPDVRLRRASASSSTARTSRRTQLFLQTWLQRKRLKHTAELDAGAPRGPQARPPLRGRRMAPARTTTRPARCRG